MHIIHVVPLYCMPLISPAVVVIEVVDEEDGEEGLMVVVDLVTVLVTVEPALVAVSLHLLQEEEEEETKKKIGRETIY